MISNMFKRLSVLLTLVIMTGATYADGIGVRPTLDLEFQDPGGQISSEAYFNSLFFGGSQSFPMIFFENGTFVYVESTDRFVLSSNIAGIQLVKGGPLIPVTGNARVESVIFVDENGVLTGGRNGPDLTVSGLVDLDGDGTPDTSGFLLTGEITSFTAMDNPVNDAFVFTYDTTGGALASQFGNVIRINAMMMESTFAGDYTVNFKGRPRGKLFGGAPNIDIEKSTNGVDADDPNAGDAPQIVQGATVTWTYTVTNTGSTLLENVTVSDDQFGVTVTCPQTTLAPMETIVCTASGSADDLNNTTFTTVSGLCGSIPNIPLYENMGSVTAVSTDGEFVQDVDPSHYCNPQEPAIDIEKATNGVDADDANAGDAPQIGVGNLVTWTYVVTNTGNVDLINVNVTDDQGVPVSCPQTTLAVGDNFICTASGQAADLDNTGFTTVLGLCGSVPDTPLYENIGEVTGTSVAGQPVMDSDPSHYCNPSEPSIDIEKATNGVDADDPNAGDAPLIGVGSVVTWTYVVTNTGDVDIENLVVTDDQGVAVSCPQTTLAAGETVICSASGLADDLQNTAFTTVSGLCGGIPGTPLYENMGRATGTTVNGDFVEDIDPSHYCNPPEPSIDIEKATNGVDADDPNAGDAPRIGIGNVVNWTYVVTNTGNVDIENLVVTDDQGVAVSCPQTTLDVGEVITCTGSGLADDLQSTTFMTVSGLCGSVPGTPLYENMGRATGTTVNGDFVEDIDPSHYCNPPEPSIDIEKATNGVDADDPNAGDAPRIGIGNVVNWTYVVTNTGNVDIENLVVTDDQGVAVSCPQTTLDVGEVITCTGSGLADDLQSTGFNTVSGLCGSVPGTPLYENMGHATGTSVTGDFVEDTDPSHYCNPPLPSIDIEKATNGVDADDPNAGDAPQIGIGNLVTWTYVVTNTGNVDIENLDVTDDQGVTVSCPQTTLDVGEVITCTATGLADNLHSTGFTTVPGLCGGVPNTPLYENKGRATGTSVTGVFVEDIDPSHYCNPPVPSIDIEKATNGVDADDPNAGDAPQIGIGNLVTWTYVVTNTGNVDIENLVVTDDQGVAVSCPQTTLDVGEIITCTASGLADDLQSTGFTTVPGLCGGVPNTPLYENMGRATGTSVTGVFVEDIDPSHYCNPPVPSIDIEKATNGIDADDPNAGDAPPVVPGSVVTWTYVVTNTGDVPLSNVSVTDDQGVTPICPSTTLAPGDMFTCTATGIAEDLNNTGFTTVSGLCAGVPNVPLYENRGRATGETVTGDLVEDVDLSHYCISPNPAIDIEKATNGVDADDPNDGTAPPVPVGGVINWTYVVTNIGNVTLFDVTVVDDQGVAVSCPLTVLDPMQVMTCTGMGISLDLTQPIYEAVNGLCAGFPNSPLYENLGTVTGVSAAGQVVMDDDPSHYCNPRDPDIDIEKLTNGVQADDPNDGTAPALAIGDTITWTYIVTNTGNVPLSNVSVVDDQGVVVSCPADTLEPGDNFTCTGTGPAVDLGMTTFTTVPGLCGGFPNTPLYENRGTVSAQTVTGAFVEDEDLSHYCIEQACEVSIDKTCLIPMAPAGDFVCDTPIDTLTFIWGGSNAVRIKAYKGSVGSTLLADIDDIQPGEEISVMGYAGSPNDVFFEIFNAGTSTKIGESKFHLSCSDNEMNGPEDCGLLQGNGKANDSGLINQWILEGIVDAGGTLDCTTQPVGGTDACTFQAFPASCETGAVNFLTFAYTGGGCAASDNDQGNSHICTGAVNGSEAVTITDDNNNVYNVSPGETFTLARNLAKKLTLVNGGGTEFNEVHTSCSQPIQAGDVYGSLTLAQIDGQGIGTEVVYAYTITNDGANALTMISANDIPLGPVPGVPSTLAAGDSVTLFNSAFLTETTTNTVVVDATDSAGGVCNAVDAVTVTIEPPPPCDVDGLGVLELSDDKLKWELTNNGAFTATIQRVTLAFPAQHEGVKEVKLDGAKFYDTDTVGTTLVIDTADFIGNLNARQIASGDTVDFEVAFLENYSDNIQGDYSITIEFEEGCSVTFVNTGLPFVCTKPIDSLSMIYDGSASAVRVKAWKGAVGSTLLADTTVANGGEITVTGYAGSPNDVFWEVFSGGTKIGESNFHMSCSDGDMNGAEDCGKREGNGKGNDSSLINDWLLEGMVDADGPFDCSNLP